MTIGRLDTLTPNDLEFTQHYRSTKLLIMYIPEDSDGDRLSAILQTEFSCIRIKQRGGQLLGLVVTSELRLQDMVRMVALVPSSTIESYSIDCQRLSLVASTTESKIQKNALRIAQPNDISL